MVRASGESRDEVLAGPVPSEVLGARRAAWYRRHHQQLEQLLRELEKNGGNVSSAARVVGISRQRAMRLMSARAALDDAHPGG
jgi:transcriptional regulator of acetoin/glycerol metabolism